MNKIIIKDYIINSNKIKDKDITIALLSDIHFNVNTKEEFLNYIKKTINSINPDYICIPGDLIDYLNLINDNKLMNKFYFWLHDLGNINNKKIPVLISLGNHDMGYKNKTYIKGEYNYRNTKEFKKYISKLNNNNIYLLDNSIYKDRYVTITGFTQKENSFHNKDSLKLEQDYFNNIDTNLLNINNNTYNISLIHNPFNLTDKLISNKLKGYNLILSGHTHNGLVPPLLEKCWHSNTGLVSPSRDFFPNNARGIITLSKDRYLIISSGITKLSYASGIYKLGNFIFPSQIEKIVITSK